jgi:3-phosphoshikimate 1-carboxyvinyltransferase
MYHHFLDLPPLRGRPARCACPARRASPTACCCWPAWPKAAPACTTCSTADDTRVMLGAAPAGLHDRACGRSPARTSAAWADGCRCTNAGELFLGNAGTAMRPLTAALAVLAATQGGRFELSGVPRMHERPIGDLVDALRPLGCTSTNWARPATRRCACAGRSGGRLTPRADPRARRRVQPVPDRAAAGAAAGAMRATSRSRCTAS